MDELKNNQAQSENNIQHKHNNDHLLNKLFFQKYRTIKKLGEGSFGKVYKAEYNKVYYAMKFENKNRSQNLLETEATIMNYLRGPNIPNIESFGTNGDYNILIMQLMDKSLEDLINIYKKFSVKTVCLLAYQIMNILQFIHDKHIIHRDIKPDNFVMGYSENNAHLYIIDFGLAKKFRSSRTLVQYPYIKKKKLTGTARYASIHALEEYEQSRRDDLESVGYVLLYFLRGSLPWQGLKVKTKEARYQKILEKKKEITCEELCKTFPNEFQIYLTYSRNLGYTDDPDYDMLRNLFVNLLCDEKGENFDYIYDWTTQSDLRKRKNENNRNNINNNNTIDGLSTSICQISEKKSVNKKESESILSIKRKNEIATNGNNYILYKSINSNQFINNNNEKDNKNENNNIFLESKDNDNKVASKCCSM